MARKPMNPTSRNSGGPALHQARREPPAPSPPPRSVGGRYEAIAAELQQLRDELVGLRTAVQAIDARLDAHPAAGERLERA
jgi:hypothetical protein